MSLMSKNSIESLEMSRQRIGIGFAITELSLHGCQEKPPV